MMAFIDNLVRRWKEDREQMQSKLELLESGKMESWEKYGTGRVDTSANQIAFCKRHIAKLDDLIARYPEDE
jgi:hypothetical protein